MMQKYIRVNKGGAVTKNSDWILGESGNDSYLASQCGNSALEKDLSGNWYVIGMWEDKYQVVF